MIPVEDSSPVLIGNKVESIIPYHMSDEFVVNAKDSGTVVERTDDYVVIKYKNGKNYAIDIENRVRHNASGGFYIENDLTCNLQVGDKFKKGDILAYNAQQFSPNRDGRGVSMNLGVLTKIAVVSNWDEYEDSTPITTSLANRLATTMIGEKTIILQPQTQVDYIVKVGDKVNTGDPLMRFSKADDEETNKFLRTMRDELAESIIEETQNTPLSKYTGEIADIRIFSTVALEEMDPSLQKVVKAYQRRIKRKTDVLDKYQNEGDCNFYKAGQIISETADIMEGATTKIKGEYLENAVVIQIFTKYRDIASKGDKLCHEFAIKGVTSHVIKEGFEPYSEYRPEEEISSLVAPLAIAARKTPSIFLVMFGNKCLIELKRQLRDDYLKGAGTIPVRRKAFMNKLCKSMDLLDPTKQNSHDYQTRLGAMSDASFDKWAKAFLMDDKAQLYLEVVEYERDLTIEQVEKCAEFLKVPLFEYVALPHITEDLNNVVVTPEPVPVGYVHEKRMPQTLMKKSAGSITASKRNPKTGQVTGDDKNARNSDVETYAMVAIGAEMGLRELMGPRADDMVAKTQMYNAIARKGYVSLTELENDPKNKVSLNTFDAYFVLQGINTNLLSPLNIIGVQS